VLAIRSRQPHGVFSRDFRLALALVGLCAVVYLPAIVRGGFVWDDDDYVTENEALRSVRGLWRIWTDPRALPQYYPLVHSSYWVELRLWGLDPRGYHLVNVLLHGIAAVLFWRLLSWLAVPGAFWAAAVFAVHPVHVESVAWITERKNVLSGVFFLGAGFAYCRWALGRRRAGGVRLYGLAAGLFLCALASKTVAATLPLALLAVVWWKRGRIGLADLLPLLPLFAVGAAAGSLTAWLERHHVGAAGPDWEIPYVERLLVAGRAIWFYLGKLVWPHPLVFIYPKWTPRASDPAEWAWILAALATLSLAVALRGRIGRAPAAAAFYFVATIAPALGFVPVYPMRFSWVADHFQYLASLGPIALGMAAASRAVERLDPRVGRAVFGLLILVLGALAFDRCRLYQDEETLWRRTIEANPRAFIAYNNLGGILLERGELEEASRLFEAATEIAPHAPEAWNNLGIVRERQNRPADAIESYRAALAADPDWADAHNNLGAALASAGRLSEALGHLERAVGIRPGFSKARYNLGLVLGRLGRFERALAELEEASRLDPSDRDAKVALAVFASKLAAQRAAEGLADEARTLLDRAARAARAAGRPDLASEIERQAGPAPR